jgi:PAS domain S-box-containing protein
MRRRSSSSFVWPAALIGIVVLKVFFALAIRSASWVAAYSAISYFLLLFLAACFAVRNAVQNTLSARQFWVFLAIADGLWALDQWLYLYYGLGLHIDVPDNSIADPVLFLHIVPLMAAAAALPHRNTSERKAYPATLNFLLLLFFWSFLYGYTVVPYQYLFPNATSYALRFDVLYLLENLLLVLALFFLILRARLPWKSIYLHLFGASALYALSSAAANLAIDSTGYVNGKLYGIGLTASVCWFVWIPLRARELIGTDASTTLSEGSPDSLASVWAMLAVVLISIPIVWQLFQRNENAALQKARLVVAIIALVGLASAAFVGEYLAKRELAVRISIAHDRLRLAMESGKTVGWDSDVRSGRDIWFGDLKTMFGIPSDIFSGRVEDFIRRVHPDDRSQVWKAVKEAKQGHQRYSAEHRILWEDGTLRWIATQGQFYYAADGEAERMLGMAVDITERKRVEESLRLFRTLVDESNDAIYVIDPESRRIIDVNGKSCVDLGYSREELLSMTAYDIDPDADAFPRVIDALRNSGSVIFETCHRRRDGSTFAVEVSIKRVRLDRSYSVCVARDITDRKRAEIALRNSEESYRNFVAQSSEGIFREDLDAPIPVDLPEDDLVHRILYDSYMAECNDAIAKMYGLSSQQEFLGKRLTETLDPNDPRNVELTRDYIRSGFRILDRESHEVDILGNPKVFLNSMIGIVENGKLVRTWGIQRDITERVRLENANKQAEQALRESQAELVRAARIATMGELTALIAHEINQPLAAVATDASATLHWLAARPPNLDEAQEAAKGAVREARRASLVIERIRTLLQKTSPRLRPLDINEVIREVLILAHAELITASVAVHTELAATAPVLGDRVQLQQVLLNLVMNAIDSMSAIRDRPTKLLITSAMGAEEVLVQVQDSGQGLDPENAHRIFDSFFTTKPEGTGMGLSISRSIVEAHGGRLLAMPGSPHGAVFQVALPKTGGNA